MNIMSLDGPWKARFSDFQRGRPNYANRDTVDAARYLDVTVPGEIHLDLMRLGILADLYKGANVLSARWVEEQIWSYRKVFDAPQSFGGTGGTGGTGGAGSRAWLVFESLDLVAEVVLNGQTIATHNNSFLPLRVEVTGKLRSLNNVLAVHLDSGLYHVAEKPVEGWHHGNAKDQVLHKRHWLRKPQCQFSWDWAPRLVNVGIQGSVRLEYTNDLIRVDRFVPRASLSEDLRTGSVAGKVWVESFYDQPEPVQLNIEVGKASLSKTCQLAPGMNTIEFDLEVEKPDLWWPINQGPQSRYEVRGWLEAGAERFELPSKHVGFRHVRVNQDKHPQRGQYFFFEINGRKVFCKGANLVPADLIVSAIDSNRYQQLVSRAIEANFNLLRVWGGGLYEHDTLFDLCDQLGLLVWQEFIFACGKYPTTDEHFNRNVIREATHQVRRLAHHPSLIAWCGNNENETMHWNWGPGETGVIAPDYGFYHLTLPRVIRAEHPEIYYQPSSPISFDRATNPNDDHSGDQHPWGVGFANTDFRDYRKMECRFANEGGILGPTSLPTMLACLGDGQHSVGQQIKDQQHVQSFMWQVHDNSVDSWEEPSSIDRMTTQWLGLDCRTMTVEQYVYWGGLIQGEGLGQYIDNFRRRMFDSGSAVFWMYNDTWPATRSWTIVDHAMNRTPSFHPVRRAFEPIHVVLAICDDSVVVFGVNDTPETVHATLRFGLFSTAGQYALDQTLTVDLPACASTPVARFPTSAWKDPNREIAFATLHGLGDAQPILLSRNRLILPFFKDIKFETPEIRVSQIQGKAVFECDVYAFNVCVDLDGRDDGPNVGLGDNFFDLYPGQPYAIDWPGAQKPQVRFVGNLPAK